MRDLLGSATFWTAVGSIAAVLALLYGVLRDRVRRKRDGSAPLPFERQAFTGDDLALQDGRLRLAKGIGAILDRGIDTEAAEAVWAMGLEEENASHSYVPRGDLLPLHLKEVSDMREWLNDKAIRAKGKSGRAKDDRRQVLHYIGITLHNLASGYEARARRSASLKGEDLT